MLHGQSHDHVFLVQADAFEGRVLSHWRAHESRVNALFFNGAQQVMRGALFNLKRYERMGGPIGTDDFGCQFMQ